MADEISTVMSNCQGKIVLLRLRNTKTIQGALIDFDIHMNLTLNNAEDISEEKHLVLEKFCYVEIIFWPFHYLLINLKKSN